MKEYSFIFIFIVPIIANSQSILNSNSINPFALRNIVAQSSKSQLFSADKPVDLFLPTSVYITSGAAVTHDVNVQTIPIASCSVYDGTICYNTSDFYKAKNPQAIVSGYYFFNKDDAVIIGFNTGYKSPKLIIKPSIAIGYSKHFEVAKSHQIVIEGSKWFGGSIQHKPCIDSFDREYYCASLTAWSDFHYQSNIDSYSVRLIYQWKF